MAKESRIKKQEPGEAKAERVKAKGLSAKPEVSNPKSDEENNSEFDTPHSAIDKSEIENPTSEIKTMEVHHHPEVEKKGFKEYILEGLMIFLAVTMGFFAESLREHIGDNNREKEYIHSFVEDLKKDTASLQYSIRRLNVDVKNCDQLIGLYGKGELTQLPDTALLQLSNGCGLSVDVFFNDRTASQLKGTGSMRLIRNKSIADSMLQYWNNQFRIEQVHNRFESMRIEQRKMGWKTFNWYGINYNYGKSMPEKMEIRKAISNVSNLNEFVNICSTIYNAGGSQYLPQLQKQLGLAEAMIGMIKKEYSLDNE